MLPLHAFRCSILFRLHRLHPFLVARFFSDASAFTSSRTSYRLLGLGYVVHHSVGKHVRSLLALGYDSLEYFIFYIPLDTLDLVTYFDQQSIFDSISRKLESTRARTSGQTVYVNLHLCLVLARPVCWKFCTCISRFCMLSTTCILHGFYLCTFCIDGMLS